MSWASRFPWSRAVKQVSAHPRRWCRVACPTFRIDCPRANRAPAQLSVAALSLGRDRSLGEVLSSAPVRLTGVAHVAR